MILNREEKYKGHLKIDEITVKTKKGAQIKREVMRRKNAVAALVYDTIKKKYIFVSQFRPGVGGEIIEIPAGTLDHPGEDPREAMKRELEEEIGYKTDSIILLNECYMSPGGSTEVITIYFCNVSKKEGEGGGLEEENEEIDIIEMDKQEMKSTRFNDAKTIIAVDWAINNHR